MNRSTSTKRTLAAGAGLALTLALGACGGDGDGPDDPTLTAPSTSASAGPTTATASGDYATTAELAAALNTGGLSCTELRDGTFPGVSSAQSCILNDSEDVVLLKFATDAEKQDYLTHREAYASAVVGDDWAVQTVLPTSARAVAAVIGGEVVEGAQATG